MVNKLYGAATAVSLDPVECAGGQESLRRLERVPTMFARMAPPPAHNLLVSRVGGHHNAKSRSCTIRALHRC